MTGNRLIDEYQAALCSRLPQPIVDELLDGLADTYAHQLTNTIDEHAAAQATINEFGDPDMVVRAFIHHSAGRRLARRLLTTGPLVGVAWAAVLITSRAWSWPVPLPIHAAFGLALFGAIGALLTSMLNKDTFERAQATSRIGALTLITLDATLVTAAVFFADSDPRILLAAVAASALRVTFTVHRLPQLRSA